MSRTPLPRPTLLPGLPRIWRNSTTLQLGMDPARAVLLDLPDRRAGRLLDLLDGSRSERLALAHAESMGLRADQARKVLDLLHEAGLVVPAQTLFPPAMPDRLTGEAGALAFAATPPTSHLPAGYPPTSAPPGPRRASTPPQAPRPARTSTPPQGTSPGPDPTAPSREMGSRPSALPAGRASAPPAGSALSTSRAPRHTSALPCHAPALTRHADAYPVPPPASPAHTLRRRAAARVVVTGRGRLAAGVAVALAEAGVGHVHPDLPGPVGRHEWPGSPLSADDTDKPRTETVAAAIIRAAPGTETRTVRRGAASLFIHLGHDQPPALLAISHANRRQPYLIASIREGKVLVGPLVPPATAPCLNCITLHRHDRDPEWPDAAAAQAHQGTGGTEPCAVATLLAATGFLVGEALAFLDGAAPETIGAEMEISRPGRFRRRTWPPHPACQCTARPPRDPRPTPSLPQQQAEPGLVARRRGGPSGSW